MFLEKLNECRLSCRNRIITDKMPKAQQLPQIHCKSLVKTHGQLIAAERLLL